MHAHSLFNSFIEQRIQCNLEFLLSCSTKESKQIHHILVNLKVSDASIKGVVCFPHHFRNCIHTTTVKCLNRSKTNKWISKQSLNVLNCFSLPAPLLLYSDVVLKRFLHQRFLNNTKDAIQNTNQERWREKVMLFLLWLTKWCIGQFLLFSLQRVCPHGSEDALRRFWRSVGETWLSKDGLFYFRITFGLWVPVKFVGEFITHAHVPIETNVVRCLNNTIGKQLESYSSFRNTLSKTEMFGVLLLSLVWLITCTSCGKLIK